MGVAHGPCRVLSAVTPGGKIVADPTGFGINPAG